jgi:hypothetical protein
VKRITRGYNVSAVFWKLQLVTFVVCNLERCARHLGAVDIEFLVPANDLQVPVFDSVENFEVFDRNLTHDEYSEGDVVLEVCK